MGWVSLWKVLILIGGSYNTYNVSFLVMNEFWDIWFHFGTGFWKCNEVFDYDDDVMAMYWLLGWGIVGYAL